MNRRTTRSLSLSLTPALLLMLVGCADNTRKHASYSSSSEQVETASYESSPTIAKPAQNDEFVLGESFDQDSVPSYYEPVSRLSLEQIRTELEAMYDQDGSLVRATFDQNAQPRVSSTVRAIDQAHSERLKEIVDHIGWPTRDLVGVKATQAAYMVIQHAGHDIEFQNQCLELIVDLVAQGELPASYVALLTDRIRVFSDQPQVFGTQMTMRRNENGLMVPSPSVPIEAPEHLNDRRALMGMVPHEQFVEAIQLAYEASLSEPNSAFASVETDSE
jgi:hypothetical protein